MSVQKKRCGIRAVLFVMAVSMTGSACASSELHRSEYTPRDTRGSVVFAATNASGPLTLRVDNASGYHVVVRLEGRRVGTATQGSNCFRLPQPTGEFVLEFERVGASPEYTWPIQVNRDRHWSVKLRPGPMLKYDLSSIDAANGSCLG